MPQLIEEAGEPRIVRVFHPTIHVPDLAAAEAWFQRVFGRKSIPLTAMLPSTPNYPTEYSSFTVIQDVMLDLVDPAKHTISGVQRYPDVARPVLKSIGWYVEGMAELYHRLRHNGVRSMDLWNTIAEGETPPLSPGGEVITYMTVPDDAGLQYQFMREGPFPVDPRTQDGWSLPPVQEDDPLGIERCFCHSVLTQDIDRVRRLFVTIFGGRIVAKGRSDIVEGASTFIALADAIFEFIVPDAGSDPHSRLVANGGLDIYHGIGWKVTDLARVKQHLSDCGVAFRTTAAAIETDAETSLGVPWRFTQAVLPG